MTRSVSPERINVLATVQQAIGELQRRQKERILRELRYVPKFSGELRFVLKFKHGVPFAYREELEDNNLIPPVTE